MMHRTITPSLLRRILGAVLLALLLLTTASMAHAQSVPITLTGVNDLAFGSMYRSSTSSVSPTSSSAAEFTLTGRQGKTVRLIVTYTPLTRYLTSMTPTITAANCKYSTDNGTTWTTFSSGSYHDITLPNGSGSNNVSGTVLIKIGGSLSSSSYQQWGLYRGTISISGTYLLF